MTEEIDRLKEAEKEKLWEDVEKTAVKPQESHTPRPAYRPTTCAWNAGGLLIALAIFLLVTNLTGHSLHNWWAIFILFPAVAKLSSARRSYRRRGYLSHGGRSALTGGLFLLCIALIFLFGISWSVAWPFFLIIFGLNLLLAGASRPVYS